MSENFTDKENVIVGRHAVREALRSGRAIDRLYVLKDDMNRQGRELSAMARERGIVVSYVDRQRLDNISGSTAHQGFAAFIPARDYVELDDIFEAAEKAGEPPFIVLLDEIEDPHNLGSILRSAHCMGAHGIIIPKRRAASLTAAAVKASSGASELIGVCKVTNLVATMKELKERGVWIAGADMDAQPYHEAALDGPIALVIGAEGAGLGRLVRETCDFLVSIPITGSVQSLGASVAAGILLSEIARRRRM